MSSNVKEDTNNISLAMERTRQCVFPEDIPSDILIQVGETKFPLHKIMLLGKSNYIRRLILESKEPNLGKIDLTDIPGGAEIFEKVATFCYGIEFEITLDNVAALHCAAEYLEMTDEYCDGNLASRTYDFLTQVAALKSLSGAITVLKSCEYLLPRAEELVQKCVGVASTKACEEAHFPSCSPPNWWTQELSTVNIMFFKKIMHSMKSRGAEPLTITGAITTYAKRWFPDFFHENGVKSMISDDSTKSRATQREVLDTIVSLLPVENQESLFSTNFLCRMLNTAIFLENEENCKKQLEKRISATLDHVTVNDLLILSYTFDGELCDLVSVRRIVNGFMEKDKSVPVFNSGNLNQAPSPAMLWVVKTVDEYLNEIAKATELSISKFNGIANLVPKNVRQVDDDLYRAIDIYLQAHPNLDEIQKEKVCSAMDPLKLSTEARLHASQNKRFPLQIVLHSLYYDQLQVRSGQSTPGAQSMRLQVHADVALAKENENLRSELLRMKMYISDMEKGKVGTSSSKLKNMKKPSFLSSVSKKLGKLNPFKQGSKDTSNIDDGLCHTTPRRRRFSMS
ncbi:phototropic-responsive NPH3 family protein [Artemisia annua]|uniref:Phototropic-responsive NPH3 family protein n=1 Tax=Artemisia annua TaxID=35608 RepID=A0A2U1L0Y0_ARTAN|nr:phototropic-responsive NPH3 family protein [Artemisia annua]